MADAPVPYVCPGEAHSISRSVHYARLAAYYPACRQCLHRHDAGHLAPVVARGVERTTGPSRQSSLIRPEGIRGVYLNEMTRPLAERLAAGFAACLLPAGLRPGRHHAQLPDLLRFSSHQKNR